MSVLQELMWKDLRREVRELSSRVDKVELASRQADTAGGVRAKTLAEAPLAADGGMSDGTEFIDLLWISNGRKPGEDAGFGTGVLAYYDASLNAWLGVHDFQVVTA